nr:MAG TPA: hypothetical protein [Caudoviricetes sp.]
MSRGKTHFSELNIEIVNRTWYNNNRKGGGQQ